MEVFLDLDDTVVGEDRSPDAEFKNINYSSYSFLPGAKEFIAILKQTFSRISFYSAGSMPRNTQLLAAISRKHFSNSLEYGLLQAGDDLAVGKKTLQGAVENVDVERAILVDDLSHLFAAPGEERNFLQVIPNLCRGSEKVAGLMRHYKVVKRNALLRALGIVLWAFHLSTVTEWSLVEALSAIQWDSRGFYRHAETNRPAFYKLGLAAMQTITPHMKVVCDEGIEPWNFPFDHALSDNKFEKDQVERIISKLPSKRLEEALVPPEDFHPMTVLQLKGL